jgi:hypothetical protein
MLCSMSRKGDRWGNAPTESFLGSLKTELMEDEPFATRPAGRTALFGFIEGFYLCFQDEVRVGQKGRTGCHWWMRGQRPRCLCAQRYDWTYLYAAVRPATGKGFALVLPMVSTRAMSASGSICVSRSSPTACSTAMPPLSKHSAKHETSPPSASSPSPTIPGSEKSLHKLGSMTLGQQNRGRSRPHCITREKPIDKPAAKLERSKAEAVRCSSPSPLPGWSHG